MDDFFEKKRNPGCPLEKPTTIYKPSRVRPERKPA